MSLVLNKVSAHSDGNTCLNSMDLEILPSGVTVVMGPGGSGKTLLLDVLAGVQNIDEGEISCRGDRDPRIVYQSAEPLLPPGYTVQGFFSSLSQSVPSTFGLLEVSDWRVDFLSPRHRRALWLSAALARTADVYLFDEPILGLDPWFRADFTADLSRIVREGAAAVIATVDSTFAHRIADELLWMQAGQVSRKFSKEELQSKPSLDELWKREEQ